MFDGVSRNLPSATPDLVPSGEDYGVSYGVVGPNLTKVMTRTTIASGIYPNDPEHLKAWIKNAPSKKPGSLMPNMNLSDADVEALVAFLQTRR